MKKNKKNTMPRNACFGMFNTLRIDRPNLSKWFGAFVIIALTFFIDPLAHAQVDQTPNQAATMFLSTRLDTVRDSLTDRIGTSTGRLSVRLDSVKDSLETRIESTETVLKDSIATSTKRLNTRLNSVKDSLRADIESTETVLKDSITTSATRLNTRLNSVKDSLNSVNRKVQTASESVASLSAKIDALMALNTRIDSLLKAGKNTTDQ